MSWLDSLYLMLQASVFWLLIGACVAVWWLRRKHVCLLWLAASAAFCAIATYKIDVTEPWPFQASVVAALWAAACCAAQAMALRFGRNLHAWWVAGSSLCLLFVLASGVSQPASLVASATASTLAVILGHALPVVWRSAKRHRADHALQWLYALLVFGGLVGPWISIAPAMTVAVPSGLAMLVAVTCVCVLHDGAAPVRAHRYSDGLTGLLNRSGLEAACGKTLGEQGISVIALCEFDSFARPDYAGDTGQKMLCDVAQLLQDSVREGDQVARVAEQAFVLALRHISMADAQAMVERIKSCLHQQTWAHKPEHAELTMSFSLAQVREEDSLSQALHRADVLLFQAKEEGRNCLVIDEEKSSSIAVFS